MFVFCYKYTKLHLLETYLKHDFDILGIIKIHDRPSTLN